MFFVYGCEVFICGGEFCDYGEEFGGLELERNLLVGVRYKELFEVRILKCLWIEFLKFDGFFWFFIIFFVK